MADYISREAAISEILSEPTDAHYPSWYAEKLKQIPAADVRPVVRGRWTDGKCDQCGEHAPYWCMASAYHTTNFCPNCGADMRGGESE